MTAKRILQLVRLGFAVMIIAALTILRNANQTDNVEQATSAPQEASL